MKAKPFDRNALAQQIEDALTCAATTDATLLRFDSATLHRLAAALAAVARGTADAHDALARELQATIDDLSERIRRLEQERQR